MNLEDLRHQIVACRSCPRLVEWREHVAAEKRAAFADDEYWGRPVPGFGDPTARLVIVGLAPAAHGANRTGRMFTGDRSGDWLFRALHRAGFASQAESTSRHDGLELDDVWVTAAVRCAPPGNKPTTLERDTCSAWLAQELDLLSNARVYVALGQFGFVAFWRYLSARRSDLPKPRPRFGHGVVIELDDEVLLTSYHPSQQNTFTGKLTEDMFEGIFVSAREALGAR